MYDISTSQLIDHFCHIDDPRVDRTKEHLLIDMVVIAICAVVCGAEGWTHVEQYGKDKLAWLQTFLTLPNGIPSHDTFGRLFARIDAGQFQSCFAAWVQSICHLTDGEIIAIDGKTVRHSFDTTIGQSAIHMVSAWASTNRLVLGQVKVDEKSNEITAIPELLRTIDITDTIVTIDAMGCQKAIAEQIVAQKANYLLALKSNQETLFKDVQALFAHIPQSQDATVCDYYETYDIGHGRSEIRRYWSTDQLDELRTKHQWQGLRSIGMSISERSVQGRLTTERRYYIASLPVDAKLFGEAVRTHWEIENAVHWVLDVSFREDDCRIRLDHGPENFAVLRHIALNLLRQETSFQGSIKAKRLKAGWSDTYLAKVLCLS